MRIIVTALSAARRGEPLTTTRPYALLPLLKTTLLRRAVQHAAELARATKTEAALLTTNPGRDEELLREGTAERTGSAEVIDARDEERTAQLLKEAVVIPGDLLLNGERGSGEALKPGTIITTGEESEEGEALGALLKKLGLSLEEREERGARINYPWELLNAQQKLLRGMSRRIHEEATIEEGVVIKGVVVIGAGTIVKSGTYIEGPVLIGKNCVIGPHAHLRPDTVISDECRIGKTELVDALIMRKSTSKHHSYLGHSILGENVNIGAFTVTADYRHDAKPHVTIAGGERVPTGRRKLGAFLGDGAKTGVSTSFYPGRKLWPGETTLPGEVVREDKKGGGEGASRRGEEEEVREAVRRTTPGKERGGSGEPAERRGKCARQSEEG